MGSLLKTSGCAIAIVSLLTLLFYKTWSSTCLYLLYPGLVLPLYVAGGHGGNTQFEGDMVIPAGLILNTLVYTVVFSAVLAVRSHFRKKRGS